MYEKEIEDIFEALSELEGTADRVRLAAIHPEEQTIALYSKIVLLKAAMKRGKNNGVKK